MKGRCAIRQQTASGQGYQYYSQRYAIAARKTPARGAVAARVRVPRGRCLGLMSIGKQRGLPKGSPRERPRQNSTQARGSSAQWERAEDLPV
jgi:hypothetical protein